MPLFIRISIIYLVISTTLIPVHSITAQDTNTQVMKTFQEFSQINRWPLPSIKWDDFIAARNNNSGDLPALLKKPLTAVKGQVSPSGAPELHYQGNFLYYIPGGECLRIEISQGEAIVYGGYTLVAIISEYTSADAAGRAVENNYIKVKGNVSSGEKFQGKATSIRQSRGYEYSYSRERTVDGTNKKTSELQQVRIWSQGRYEVLLAGGYEGCTTKGPEPFSLTDQLYDLVGKYLTGETPVPLPLTSTPASSLTLTGKVTDGFRHTLPNLFMRLKFGTNEEVTRTDSGGKFTFTNLPPAAIPGYNPQTDAFTIEVLFQYLDKAPVKQRVVDPIFQLFSSQVNATSLVRLSTPKITVSPTSSTTTYNIDLANSQVIQTATPSIAELKKAGLIYYNMSLGVQMAAKLGPPMNMLPIDVIFNHPDHPTQPNSAAWWDGSIGTYNKPRPSINITRRITSDDEKEISYVILHEFGHHFMADTYANSLHVQSNRKAHGGYCLNSSSNDSWIEGWATFFPALVYKEILNSNEYWRLHRSPTVVFDLESNLKPWHIERLAAAGVLMDLLDNQATYPTGKDDDPMSISVGELWELIAYGVSNEAGSNGHIFDMVDLYFNLKFREIGQGDANQNGRQDLDDLFILHGFYEIDDPDGNSNYVVGKQVAYTSHGKYAKTRSESGTITAWCNEMKPRRTDPLEPGSYIFIDTKNVPQGTTFLAEVVYSAPNAHRNYSFSFTADQITDGRVYLMLPDPSSQATIRITAGSQFAKSQPVEITSTQFWQKVPGTADQPLMNASFNIKSQPVSWILGFVIGGVLLALTILVIGVSRMNRKAASPAAYPRWTPTPTPQKGWYEPPRK